MPPSNDAGNTELDASVADGSLDQPDAQADAAVDSAVADATVDASAGNDAGSDAATPDAGPHVVTPSAAGQLVITEIQAAPAGYAADELGEWVELYNPSEDTTYNLANCIFSDQPGDMDYTFQTLHIAPKSYLAFSPSTFTVALQGFVSDAVYGTGSALNSKADGPNIVCNAVIIDKVDYSAAGGFPVPSNSPGHTIQLSASKLDGALNDVGTNWCFSTNNFFTVNAGVTMVPNYGTPKAANIVCP